MTGRFYVGMHSTSSLEDDYIGSGKRLWYSIQKYGRENHTKEILEFLPDRKSLSLREEEIVNREFLKDPLCMNLAFGGDFGAQGLGGKVSIKKNTLKAWISLEKLWKNDQWREKILNSEKRRKTCSLGGHASVKGKIGQHLTEVHRLHISEALKISAKGERNSQFDTCWMNNGKKNIKVKREEVSKMSSEWKLGRRMKFGT